MKVIVIEMCIEFRENARLIWSPGVAKLHILPAPTGILPDWVARANDKGESIHTWAQKFKADVDRYAKVIKAANIKVD